MFSQKKWAGADSNRRPPLCESGVLTELDDRPDAQSLHAKLKTMLMARTGAPRTVRPREPKVGPWVARPRELMSRSFRRARYFFTPRARFLSRRSSLRHFRQRDALIAFFDPQRRQTLKKRRRFWAICFFTTSVMGTVSSPLLASDSISTCRYFCTVSP